MISLIVREYFTYFVTEYCFAISLANIGTQEFWQQQQDNFVEYGDFVLDVRSLYIQIK